MGKFKFKFENIVRIKEAIKKKTQRDIGLIDKKILKIHLNIEETKEELQKEKQFQFNKQIRVKDLQAIERHELYIKKKLKSFENEIEKLKKIRELKVEELTLILKDEKMFELLRAKHFEKYTFEEYKTETRAFDEMAIQKSGRGKK